MHSNLFTRLFDILDADSEFAGAPSLDYSYTVPVESWLIGVLL